MLQHTAPKKSEDRAGSAPDDAAAVANVRTRISIETVDANVADRPVVAAMAALPEHQSSLAEAAWSLLPQCDELRIYLGMGVTAPAALHHPRIRLRRALDWDERGEAGSFAWMAADDPPGFRLMTSAGVVYPANFTATLRNAWARYDGRAIVGVDGALLRQAMGPDSAPIAAMPARADRDRFVHWLGMDAVLFDSLQVRMSPDDFIGMPAYALARHAQRNAIAMVAVSHGPEWLRRGSPPDLARVWVNDGAAVTTPSLHRTKYAVAIVAHEVDALGRALAAWDRDLPDGELALIVAAANGEAPLRDAVAGCVAGRELHVLANPHSSGDWIRVVLRRAAFLAPDLLVVVSDSVFPNTDGWAAAARALCRIPGSALVAAKAGLSARPRFGTSRRANTIAIVCGGDVLAAWREAEEETSEFSDFEQLLNHSASKGLEFDRVTALEQQLTVEGSGDLPRSQGVAAAPEDRAPPLRVNEVFRRRLVINLDRRADRWASMSKELQRARIEAERVPAVDGTTASVAAEYADYSASPLVTVSDAVRSINDSLAFFSDYDSQRARVAHLETTTRQKAITSAGAWAYLQSWRNILRAALRDGVESLLVFDDDVVFHADAEALFSAAIVSAREDWLVLQLGTLQYNWSKDWLVRDRPPLWRTNGAAVGSHAVGLRAPAMPYLLMQVERMDMPFDIGALSATIRAFRDHCFVIRPNIAIQRLDSDSDIQSSPFQASRSAAEIAAAHRWRLTDYPGLGTRADTTPCLYQSKAKHAPASDIA